MDQKKNNKLNAPPPPKKPKKHKTKQKTTATKKPQKQNETGNQKDGVRGKKFVFLEVYPQSTHWKQSGMGTSSLQKDGEGIKIIVIAFSKLKPQWSILMKERM